MSIEAFENYTDKIIKLSKKKYINCHALPINESVFKYNSELENGRLPENFYFNDNLKEKFEKKNK